MYNWRARLGCIVPGQSIEALPRDFWRMAPHGVSLILASAGIRELDVNEVDAAIARLERSAEELRDHNADIVHISGLPLVTFKGPESEKDLIDKVKTWCGGKPVTTDFQANMNAFRALGTDKVVLISPNKIEATETYRRSAKAVGIEVLHVECHDSLRRNIPLISDREIYHFCWKALQAAPNAKAIWAPSANYNILDLIEVLEDDFGIPVVTTNQAWFWWAFMVLRLNPRNITGFGKLLQARVDPACLP
jgi:maleate isomerase